MLISDHKPANISSHASNLDMSPPVHLACGVLLILQ